MIEFKKMLNHLPSLGSQNIKRIHLVVQVEKIQAVTCQKEPKAGKKADEVHLVVDKAAVQKISLKKQIKQILLSKQQIIFLLIT